jgi:hypothetical protein
LRTELALVEKQFASLQQLQGNVGKKRRGRKSMESEERLQVSARMKAYWATRRTPRADT